RVRTARPWGTLGRWEPSAMAAAGAAGSTPGRSRGAAAGSWAARHAPSVSPTACPWLTPYRLVSAYDRAWAAVVFDRSIARPARWLPMVIARAAVSSASATNGAIAGSRHANARRAQARLAEVAPTAHRLSIAWVTASRPEVAR